MESLMSTHVIDMILAFFLVFLCWKILHVRDLLVGIILFIIFGLLVSLAWVRLQAPDIALVEAIIGSALTGALFLGCLGYMESPHKGRHPAKERRADLIFFIQPLLIALFAGVMVILSRALLTLDVETPGLTKYVQSALSKSGVENPVTAVVLNFRGYDTLLEIGVLFLVVVSIYALQAIKPVIVHAPWPQTNKILMAFIYGLVPLMILVAFYLFWIGTKAPGGAFQAGAMLAGIGVLMLLSGLYFPLDITDRIWRFFYVVGFAGFLSVGLGTMWWLNHFLEYPETQAKQWILFIELLATISITWSLVALFAGCSGFPKIKKE